MEPSYAFMADLTVAVVAAALGGFIASRLRLSPILGYLAAGVIIGPFTPGYVVQSRAIQDVSELGLIFLLFSIGLGFSLGELRAIGALPLVGNVVLMVVFVAGLGSIAALVHLPNPVTLALIMTLSSTAIGVALLRQWDLSDTPLGRLVVATLIVQDLIAAVLLVIVDTPADALSLGGVVAPLFRAIVFVAVALVAGATVLRAFVVRVLRRAPTEPLFGAFASVALVAAWLGHLAGLSFEFGAFIAGAVVSEAAGSRMVQSIIEPFRALFVSLFFVAMGLSIDLTLIREHWGAIVLIAAAFILLRVIGWGTFGRIAGLSTGGCVLAAVALIPLGEFNIALVNGAAHAARVTRDEHAILLGVTFISILVATVGGSLVQRFPRLLADSVSFKGLRGDAPAALIVGFGRVGRTVAAALSQAGLRFAAIDRDKSTVERARKNGLDIALGDGSDPLVLEAMRANGVRIIVATTPDGAVNAAIARRLASADVVVLARAGTTEQLTELRASGAAVALVPETEGALQLARAVLERLGVAERAIDAHLDVQRATRGHDA